MSLVRIEGLEGVAAPRVPIERAGARAEHGVERAVHAVERLGRELGVGASRLPEPERSHHAGAEVPLAVEAGGAGREARQRQLLDRSVDVTTELSRRLGLSAIEGASLPFTESVRQDA